MEKIISAEEVKNIIRNYTSLAMGWNFALFVWLYALVAFVITDFLKVKFYDVLNHKNIKFSK